MKFVFIAKHRTKSSNGSRTLCAAIAGALKKKYVLDVQSEKIENRGRVYRIKP